MTNQGYHVTASPIRYYQMSDCYQIYLIIELPGYHKDVVIFV